ncbi:MAG: hypothetical protein WCL03_14025 [Bacteroidota bacterium]
MNKYDKAFFQQARMGYSNFARTRGDMKENVLKERKHELNKQFEFTAENINRLKNINNLLFKKSFEAYQTAETFENNILAMMRQPNSFIFDYDIQFQFQYFSEVKYSHIPSLQGNPFFEHEPIFYHKADRPKPEIEEAKDWLFNTSHTEIKHEDHPLNNFSQCYIFHDLLDHTILSYQDIIDIEDIWIDVILRVQNFHTIIGC